MKVHFDEKADAIYLKLNDVKIIDSEEVTPGVILDFDKDNQVELLQMKMLLDIRWSCCRLSSR